MLNNTFFAVDIGNTNCKIRLANAKLITLANTQLLDPQYQINYHPKFTTPITIAVVSVIDSVKTKLIIQRLITLWQINNYHIDYLTTAQILKHTKIAQPLNHIGADRALKIYYLTQLNPRQSHLSFGCGSAFTIEVLSQSALVASYILPGLGAQLSALQQVAPTLPNIQPSKIAYILQNEPFYTTTHSISAGVLTSYSSLIQQLQQQWELKNIVGSGAYAHLVAQGINESCTIIDNLETQMILELFGY